MGIPMRWVKCHEYVLEIETKSHTLHTDSLKTPITPLNLPAPPEKEKREIERKKKGPK
jgi:hypothetical protein